MSLKKANRALEAEDYETAVRLLTSSADSGNVLAQFQLGLMYKTGYKGSVPKDFERAFSLLLKTAEQDHWTSQYMIASMYANGEGVSEDRIAALKWASIAAGRGSRSGLSQASKLRGDLSVVSIKKAESMVDKWSKATLIDGRPSFRYNIRCTALELQIEDAEDFMKTAKTEADARKLRTLLGAVRWPSLALIYPSSIVAFSDISRRYQGLLDIQSAKVCR